MNEIGNNQIILGKRGKEFGNFISNLLMRTKLSKQNISIMTSSRYLKFFEQAFTHKIVNPVDNYEFFEILGDVTCNKAIVWYLKDRFPFLNNSDGVKVIARLKINLVSRDSFAKWSKNLGFLDYISYDLETKVKHHAAVMEDCLEAFVGVTEFLIDNIHGSGGYFFAYQFIKSILDEEEISLAYEILYDPVTRLKETFDYYTSVYLKNTCPFIWGNIKFESKKKEDVGHIVKLIQKSATREQIIASLEGLHLTEMKHKLCSDHLHFLKEKGFGKPINSYYTEIETCRKQFESIL
jgi:dsRNA-specific ribonuclease